MIETILLQMAAVAIPLVFLIDFGGFVEKFKKWVFYKIYNEQTEYEVYDLKPFDCSACLTVWIYWIVFGILAYLGQQSVIEFLYIFIEGFSAGMLAILIRNKILF